MRDFSKFAATFWTGDTGRKLRGDCEAQVVAIYLFTGPMANMIGLYQLPVALIADNTGIPFKGASKALRRVCETGLCSFDGVTEHVFVHEMAARQIGEPLNPKDKQVVGIIRLWQSMRKSPFYMDFYRRYRASFHLPEPSPIEAPSEPPRSQEMEKEKEKEKEKETEEKSAARFEPPTEAEVAAYCQKTGKQIDVTSFVAFYASKGWMVGKSKMVSWERAVDGWYSRDQRGGRHRSNGVPTDRAATILKQAHAAATETAHE